MESGTQNKRRAVVIATSNAGKLRDFAAAAAKHGIEIAGLRDFDAIPSAREDAPTFEANACKKAEHYSRYAKTDLVLADDSGLQVDALSGAPGVRSARYAADEVSSTSGHQNSSDEANNRRLLREMQGVSDDRRGARFVCSIAVARNGRTIALFRGEASGVILRDVRGAGGFGYDPLFYIAGLKKTFAELSPAEKAEISHRGRAFEKFLSWYEQHAFEFAPERDSPPQ